MDTKKIYSIFLLLCAEALIIICFLYFGHNLESKIITLNICVTSIILLLLYADIVLPRINLKDKTQKTIGILGVRGVVVFVYMFLAIGAMIIFNIDKPVEFNTQLIVHGIILLFLGTGLYYTMAVAEKVVEVNYEEKNNRGRIDEMKKITKEVQIKLDKMKNIPGAVTEKINMLQDNLRFLAPSDKADAISLESDFINEMKILWGVLFNVPPDYDAINEQIGNCERVYKERKQQYSN